MSEAEGIDGRIVLLLGGARAGKSLFALRLAEEREASGAADVAFIATAEALDDEMAARIARHKQERPAHWHTIEEPYAIDEALRRADRASTVILDCLTLFVSNWMLRNGDGEDCEERVTAIIERFLAVGRSNGQTVVCVSNETGLGVVPGTPLGRRFRDVLGRVNQQVAKAADQAYLLVAGLPLRIKPDPGNPQFLSDPPRKP